MDTIEKKVEKLLDILKKCWSTRSSSKYSIDSPARGQCSVTSLVVNDLLGGKILKTNTPEGWHFYNSIENKRYDLTKSQFEFEPMYDDILSSREEAFLDVSKEQYTYLSNCVGKKRI